MQRKEVLCKLLSLNQWLHGFTGIGRNSPESNLSSYLRNTADRSQGLGAVNTTLIANENRHGGQDQPSPTGIRLKRLALIALTAIRSRKYAVFSQHSLRSYQEGFYSFPCRALIGSSGFYLHGSQHLSRQSAERLRMKGESGISERELSVAVVSSW